MKDSPYDVLVTDIQANSVVISWKTVNDMPTYIKLGDSEELLGSGIVSNFHRVRVIELDESTKYSFQISDGERDWNIDVVGVSVLLSPFAKSVYEFKTIRIDDEISLPDVKELHTLPDELVYVTLYSPKKNEYSEIKSYYANKYGGVAIDVRSFSGEWDYEDIEVYNIDYFLSENIRASKIGVYAAEVNCNQNVPPQTIDGISKEEFADLATRWVAGRGKHYALECFDDVVYRSRMAGVDPAFTLAVWLNESGASNYKQSKSSYGYIEDWGIHGRDDVPPQDFNAQLKHFLNRGHYHVCPGLTQWEAWGNIYRWGTCNTNVPVTRQEGIDYYKRIESLYRWITNGKNLPKRVTGRSIPINEGEEWTDIPDSLCCALKLENKEEFVGAYKGNIGNGDCDEVWTSGTSAYGGTIEYAEKIPRAEVYKCEVKYQGVCCHLPDDVRWYPEEFCPDIVQGVSTNEECKEYAKEMTCFFRGGKYKWLPKAIDIDRVEGVTTKSQCESRNDITTYTLSLKEGVNFVGFDFSPSYNITALYASTLLKQNPNILLIGNFQGYEWKDLVKQSEKIPFVGQDFYFEQNRGYLIITKEDISLQLDGWRNPDVQFQELQEGWNLVGGSIYSRPSKASMLISNLKESNIDVDTVGVWQYDLGAFIFRKEEQGDVYGIDISLEENQGIFLRK